MSIGPTKEDEGIVVPAIDRARYAAKQSVTTYFNDPVHYLFWGLLTAIALGLLAGLTFSFELYIILGVLGVVKFFQAASRDEFVITGEEMPPVNIKEDEQSE